MENITKIRNKSRFGQNFLNSVHHLDLLQTKILEHIPKGSRILEVGPGAGALTDRLIKHYDVTAVEIDLGLMELLSYFRLEKLLNVDFCKMSTDHQYYVGNLAYNRAVEIMLHAMSQENFKTGIFLIQREVAEKIRTMGKQNRLSFIFNLSCNITHLMNIPGCCFKPHVPVTGSVILLKIKQNRPPLETLIKSRDLFKSPRRKIKNNVKQTCNLGEYRVEQLTLQKLLEIVLANQQDISVNHSIKL